MQRFFEPQLAQSTYLIGCAACGVAIVIDPNRDVDTYITGAAAHNLAITHVTETHIHADFLSGSRELAARTGATLLLSDEGDADWKYAYAGEAADSRRRLHHDRQRPDRRRAHAVTHARAPHVSDHGCGGR
ncbi:MAG: hypothetical protein H0T71_09085 [Acidobacteria bacterium]|nr:hypothetical protein [Acidobacteriota bacterium]